MGIALNLCIALGNVDFFSLKILLTFREGKEEREGEKYVWLPLKHSLQGTWPTTQACALTGNQIGDPLVHRPALTPLSHTSQGDIFNSVDSFNPCTQNLFILLCLFQSLLIMLCIFEYVGPSHSLLSLLLGILFFLLQLQNKLFFKTSFS